MIFNLQSPGTVSYDSISNFLTISKGSVYEMLEALVEADLLAPLSVFTSVPSVQIRKRVKFYFSHPSLRHAVLHSLGEGENMGAYREEVFQHHLSFLGPIGYPSHQFKSPDFQIKYRGKVLLFEVGKHGRGKGGINVVDSYDARYPLYLFGFLKYSQNID